MKIAMMWCLGLTIAAACLLNPVQAMAQSKGTVVAVADVQKVFNDLKEKEGVEADLRRRAEALQTEAQQRQQEIKQLNDDMEFLAPGTPAYAQKQSEMERKAIEFQVWQQYENNKLGRERALQIENLYRKMLETIGRISQENGYQLVLYKEQPVNFAGARTEQLTAAIAIRKVLWSADDLDITNDVITRMNNDYANMTR